MARIRDDAAWGSAKRSLEGVQSYLESSPEGAHAAEARDRLVAHRLGILKSTRDVDELEKLLSTTPAGWARDRASELLEQILLEQAAGRGATIEDLARMLARFPSGRHVSAARARLAALEYDRARESDEIEGYRAVLAGHSDSAEGLKAAARIRFLELVDASAAGHRAEVREFLKDPPAIDDRTKAGLTPLLAAAAAGHALVVGDLLDAGCEIEREAGAGLTALGAAASNGRQEVVRVLVSRGADAKHADARGATPLHLAATSGSVSTVELLVGSSDVNARTKEGTTPLAVAAANGNADVVRVLLDANADARLGDDDRTSPLIHASAGGHASIVSMLLVRGGPVDVMNAQGWTAWSMAKSKGHAEISQMLEKAGAEPVSVPPKPVGVILLDIDVSGMQGGWHAAPAGYSPDYSAYHTIVFVLGSEPVGYKKNVDSRSEHEKILERYRLGREPETPPEFLPVYRVITGGRDEGSGLTRRIAVTETNPLERFLRVDGKSTSKLVSMAGRPGTRIAFLGTRETPFSPVAGLRVWQGAIDIDPKEGLIICPGTKGGYKRP